MDTEGGGTGAGMPAQPVRDGLTRLQGTERNTAALPRKGRGGGQKPFRGSFHQEHTSIKQLHCRPRNTFRCTTLFPAPEPEARSRPGTAPRRYAPEKQETIKPCLLNGKHLLYSVFTRNPGHVGNVGGYGLPGINSFPSVKPSGRPASSPIRVFRKSSIRSAYSEP